MDSYVPSPPQRPDGARRGRAAGVVPSHPRVGAAAFREDIAEVFDTAKSREDAATRLAEIREHVTEEPELLKFFDTYDRWKDGILAYFDRHETSGVVEGLNTKARVITRRSYGLKSAESLWRRLMLDVNRLVGTVRRTVAQMHGLARSIQAQFRGYYT